MPPQNQNSEERKGAGAKRKLEAMDTNDGASSKQAAEDVRPQVRLPSSDGKKRKRERERSAKKKKNAFGSVFLLLLFDSHALLLSSSLFLSPLPPPRTSWSPLDGADSDVVEALAWSETGTRAGAEGLSFGRALLLPPSLLFPFENARRFARR